MQDGKRKRIGAKRNTQGIRSLASATETRESGTALRPCKCIGGLVHLPGRGPVHLDVSSGGFFGEPMEEVAEALVEQ